MVRSKIRKKRRLEFSILKVFKMDIFFLLYIKIKIKKKFECKMERSMKKITNFL